MYTNKIKSFIAFALLSTLGVACCKDDITVQTIDERRYESITQTLAFVNDEYGATKVDSILLNNTASVDLFVNLNQAQSSDANFSFVYDSSVLTEYNAKQGTSLVALPESLISLSGTPSIASGGRRSGAVTLTVQTDESLDAMATYAVPLRLRSNSSTVGVAENISDFVLLLRDISKMPKADKDSGIKLISCLEVNGVNPLNHLNFTLENSGKPLFDQVILFSGNINYDVATGRVYNFNNENVSHILNHREKYIKPLQEKGIKVILGILGNHDRAGVANLSDEVAKQFAGELKAVLDAYELDGVFFDDEYSRGGDYPGFVPTSYEAASRLCYETKKAIGDKLVEVYVYSGTARLVAVDGVQPGDYIDYALHDYMRSYPLTTNYPGLPAERWGLYSQEFAQGRFANTSHLRKMLEQGSKTHMVFGMNPYASNYNRQVNALRDIATTFYGENLVYNNAPYKKDW